MMIMMIAIAMTLMIYMMDDVNISITLVTPDVYRVRCIIGGPFGRDIIIVSQMSNKVAM